MSNNHYTITKETITVIIDGSVTTVNKDALNFTKLREACLQDKWDEISNFLSPQRTLESWAKGAFRVEGNKIFFKDKEMPENMAKRCSAMAAEGKDPTPIFKFWERLSKNPSYRSKTQLFEFLAHEGIPLLESGKFMAYKAVRRNYRDWWTDTIENSPGSNPKMDRGDISDDPQNGCDVGLHVGSLSYAEGYHSGESRLIICHVDPEHVVCVPYDCSHKKMRTCEYYVAGNLGDQLPSVIYIEEANKPNTKTTNTTDPSCKDDHGCCDPSCPESNLCFGCANGPATCFECDLCENCCECGCGADGCDDAECTCEFDCDCTKNECHSCPNKENEHVAAAPEQPKQEDHLKKLNIPRTFKKYLGFTTLQLMELSIDELRRFATYGLKIVGASKILGGKVALVSRIRDVINP